MKNLNISIKSKNDTEKVRYAKRELRSFLKKYSTHSIEEEKDAALEIILDYREEQEGIVSDIWYRITQTGSGETKRLVISSTQEGGILSGVYDVLGRMGIRFQMNGEICEGLLDVSACDGMDEVCRPFVRWRGIRQHINFPMDISSYHLEEAKEYIRNLARMGFNSITFHSYTGQWHGYVGEKKTVYAGNFFYGQRHMVPDYPVVSEQVCNETYYCIPEIERQLSEEKERHEFSIFWLNELMKVCRQVCMHITLSIELPDDESTDSLVQIVRGVLKSYPLIDTIEWISPEGGGNGKAIARSELNDKVKEYFGETPFVCGALSYMPEEVPDSLSGAMSSLKRAWDLYQRKEEIWEGLGEKQIAVGLYVMCKETLKFLKQIMTKILPEEVLLTFLPAHGSLAVAENIAFMEFTKEELQRTMLYSWIEFDGNMYLLQNSSRGIEVLLKELAEITEGAPVHGLCLNHWRTAENELVAGYLAKASVQWEETHVFYKKYAADLGIANVTLFAEAMRALEELDCFNRDYLFNIGFCYLGCWLAPAGLGWIREWELGQIMQAMESYRKIQKQLEACLEVTTYQSGILLLRLLLNRIQCSILQLSCIWELRKICEIVDDQRKTALTDEQKEWIEAQCDRAQKYAGKYLQCHMEECPDRGCQGTAVSYYATIPVYIDHIRQYFLYGEEICTHRPMTFDAPPPPDVAYL